MARSFSRDMWLTLSAAALVPHRYRPALMRRAGLLVGRGVSCMAGLRVSRSGRIEVGEASFINFDCYIDAQAAVSIGARVLIGDHVRLITSTHEHGSAHRRAGASRALPIVIDDGCWLGSGVTVLPGVTIGAGCVIGAGALLTADTAAHGLYVGVPARRVRELGTATS